MKRVVGCAYLDAYLPVAAHVEIATGTEMAFVVELEVDGVSSHVHIEHGGVERDAQVSVGLTVAVEDADSEGVGTGMVG